MFEEIAFIWIGEVTIAVREIGYRCDRFYLGG